jgi:NAD(P)-dependent dehydrogenase (short-subunit alcohol dehydrogenase family)
MRLKDKIIFVPGGNGLIGKAIVNQIKVEGGVGIIGDLNIESNTDADYIECNVTDVQSIKRSVISIKEKYGRIDGLVNAAYPRTKDWGNKFETIAFESWQKNVNMQLNSVFALCQQVLEIMKGQGSGTVVNLASIYGMVGPDFSVYEGTPLSMPAAYSAIKGGIINFTKYLAAYYGPYKVRVNCVSPGGIFDGQNSIFVSNYEKKVPLRIMGKPEEIAGPVCFLLSNESSYITGHNLVVDGGWTII